MKPSRRKAITEQDLNCPTSWCCIDCGVNTAPGFFNQSQMFAAHKALPLSKDGAIPQDITADSEIYHVRPAVWAKAGMADFGGCLCIGCLEKRLGRRLEPKDFPRNHPFNSIPVGTERLLDRRSRG